MVRSMVNTLVDGGSDATDSTNAGIASGLETATNFGIGEALLDDPIYGAELKKVFDLYKTNKLAAVDLLSKTKC